MAEKKLTAKIGLDDSEFKRKLAEANGNVKGFAGKLSGLKAAISVGAITSAFALIKKGIDVKKEIMSYDDAKKVGAEGIFNDKYGSEVSFDTIGKISKEICGGPHVKNTSELGVFGILKEESSSAGVRRLKCKLEGE